MFFVKGFSHLYRLKLFRDCSRLRLFMVIEMFIQHLSVFRHFKHKYLGESVYLLLTTTTDPWGGTGGQNIEHPCTREVFHMKCICVIDKARFRQATLSCESCYEADS